MSDTTAIEEIPAPNLDAEDKPVEIRPQPAQARPTKALPTNRIAFSKQLDILRAFDAASGAMRKPVPLAEVAGIAKLASQTLSLANPFFLEAGLVRRGEGGGFVPCEDVHEFALAHSWGPETSGAKLAPTLMQSWAWQALEPKLQFEKTMQERDALGVLASACNAAPDFRPQLLLLLNYFDTAGLVEYDGATVRLLAQTSAPPSSRQQEQAPPSDPPAAKTAGGSGVNTTFNQAPEGLVQFAVSVRVDMAELSTWRPDRIAAFFGGIAQVLAAKGDVEQKATE